MREVGVHGPGRNEEPGGDVLVGQSIGHQSHDLALGGCQRFPTGGWAFAFTAAALRLGDRLLSGQRCALGPSGVEVPVTHSLPQRRHRGVVTVLVDLEPAANRDPAIYDDPDRLDITREGPAPMLTFGGGAHYCLGAHLARIELAEALRVITRRMPRTRRTGPAPRKPPAGISGPTSLPIAFDPDLEGRGHAMPCHAMP